MKSRGFTLVEVLVSLTLITIAVLGVLGSIAYGTKHAGTGEELAEATHVCRSIMTYLQETTLLDTVEIARPWLSEESGLNDPDTAFRQLDDAPLGGMNFQPRQLERYRRRIECVRVNDDPLNYRYKLARVKVSVFWQSKERERSVEMTGLVTISRD